MKIEKFEVHFLFLNYCIFLIFFVKKKENKLERKRKKKKKE